MRTAVRRTFRSMRVRNFRLFFVGQLISTIGLWMQQVAEVWLIYQLTHSAVALGAVTFTHFGPILFLGLWGGVVADRVDKRRTLMVTQTLLGLLAGALALISAAGGVTVAVLYGFSLAAGLVNALDNPTRRAFVREMVSTEDVPNAVSLNSMLMTSARAIGPAISSLLLAGPGATIVFAANSISYAAVIGALALMRPEALYRVPGVPRARGQLVEGLRYAWANRSVRLPIVMLAWIGTLAFNFTILLALFAEQVFASGAGGYGTLISMSAVGSLFGALLTAARPRITNRYMVGAAGAFGIVTLVAAWSTSLVMLAVMLVPVGVGAIGFVSAVQAIAQTNTVPHMQGRVMALFAVVFLGSTPLGGLIAGGVADWLGTRVAFGMGGVVCLLTAAWALVSMRGIPEPVGAASAIR
jgi:MFS family permease